MATVNKLPQTIDNYYIDFVNQLGTGETISLESATVTDISNESADVTPAFLGTPAPAVSGSQVIFWYQGGEIGHTYHVSVVVATSENRQLEGTVNFLVVRELS